MYPTVLQSAKLSAQFGNHKISQPSLLYKMLSNCNCNFVSKFPGFCPQNTMASFSPKLDGIKK